MKISPRSLAIFTATSLLTMGAWLAFWPEAQSLPAPPPPPQAMPIEKWNRDKLAILIERLKVSGSERERLALVAELSRIPVPEIPELLATIPLEQNHQLTLATRTLLIRWASADGKGAIDWSWANLKELSSWRDAFVQVCEAWAWSDPVALEQWALDHFRNPMKDPTLEEVRASETPILSSGNITRIAKSLLREDPRAAFAVFLKRGGFSTGDDFMWDSLDNPLQIEKALTAFGDLEPMKATHKSMTFRFGPLSYAELLMEKWMKVDPEGFSKSRYPGYLHPRFKDELRERTLVQEAAAEQSAEAAKLGIEASKPEVRLGLVRDIGMQWGAKDPLTCRTWAESLPPEQREQAAFGCIVTGTPAELTTTLDWLDRFAGGQAQQCFVTTYDAWSRAHPGDLPDMTAWSEQRRQAWEDLEALKEITAP